MASTACLSAQRRLAMHALARQPRFVFAGHACSSFFTQGSGQLSHPAPHRTHASLPFIRQRFRGRLLVFDISAPRCPPDKLSRAVFCSGFPSAAIEEDLRNLFEESGFCVQDVFMLYRPDTALSTRHATLILADDDAAQAAIRELDGAPLFDERIELEPLSGPFLVPPYRYFESTLDQGWTAGKSSDPLHWERRPPPLQRPRNIWKPYREGRVVALTAGCEFDLFDMYELFHNYDVDCLSGCFRTGQSEEYRNMIHFATRKEADEVIQLFDRSTLWGSRCRVSRWQIPLRFLGNSWDNGPKGGHWSGRDQGSAAGTNFQSVRFLRYGPYRKLVELLPC
ncbi:hypothetical protein C7974DRAFT_373291 [Boeremia exigua]|uniref:uncharacterized protein n=1 Tax=Boeremia exigua TaxID=749465 RepID=UPI001E8D7D0E|nr:uncharacterized protein C7974DRAFT_373291 [Boeremia exigua]KAH6638999.1 hypothetical protein C7974DRAFT_373291 [Boeremia exigua]